MEQPPKIACCGAQAWTRTIGWFKIVCGTLLLLLLGTVINDWDGRPDEMLALIIAAVGITTLIIVMNVILLLGTYRKNPRLINAWLIFAKIYLVISVFMGITGLCLSSMKESPKQLLSLVVSLVIEIYFISVVDIHKKDIEASSGTQDLLP